MINSVPAEGFAAVYPQVERFFSSFYERAKGGLIPSTLEAEVMAGERQCYIALRGDDIVACALSAVCPAGSITWDFCAGDDDSEWPEEMMQMFEDWRAAMGVRLIVICRSGWVRRMDMRKRGYRETHRIMEMG